MVNEPTPNVVHVDAAEVERAPTPPSLSAKTPPYFGATGSTGATGTYNPPPLISQPDDLASAGAVGTTYNQSTVGSTIAALPKVGQADIGTVVAAAAQVAVEAATSGEGSAASSAGIQALAHGLTQIGETLAASVGGPVAGMAADAILPGVATTLADSLSAIMQKIGMEVSKELAALTSWGKSL